MLSLRALLCSERGGGRVAGSEGGSAGQEDASQNVSATAHTTRGRYSSCIYVYISARNWL